MGSKRADTQDSVRGISETRPGVQLSSMVYNCKDQPTIPRQHSKPGTEHHYRRNEVHTHTFMEQTTAIQPLQQRRQAKVLIQAEKYKYLPDHHMKEKVEGHTMNRIKKSSFTHEVKKLQKDYPAVLTIPNPCTQ